MNKAPNLTKADIKALATADGHVVRQHILSLRRDVDRMRLQFGLTQYGERAGIIMDRADWLEFIVGEVSQDPRD